MNIDFGAKFKKCRKDKGLSIAMLIMPGSAPA